MSEQTVIDCLAFAQDARVLEGAIALRDFTRLSDALVDPAGELRYRITGGVGRMRRRFLKLELHADVSMQCQRCLQVSVCALVVKAQIWLARHEAELSAWDREAACGRRVDHAARGVCEYQCAQHHDRRGGGGPVAGSAALPLGKALLHSSPVATGAAMTARVCRHRPIDKRSFWS